MTIIRCVYEAEPKFPATDQHPDAVRYQIGDWWVDAIGGEPSEDEVRALLAPPLAALEPYQFRAMLKLSGKEQQLMAVLDALTEPAKTVALAKLEYSLKFHRDNDLVEQARQAMGLTAEALDKLWQQAAAIE